MFKLILPSSDFFFSEGEGEMFVYDQMDSRHCLFFVFVFFFLECQGACRFFAMGKNVGFCVPSKQNNNKNSSFL